MRPSFVGTEWILGHAVQDDPPCRDLRLRQAVEQDQVYIFKQDNRAELRDYSAPDGGPVDRNGAFPQTLVFSFSGTYLLVGDLLRITFTDVQTNDPGGSKPLLRDKVVNIRIANDELIMEEIDGDRAYARL